MAPTSPNNSPHAFSQEAPVLHFAGNADDLIWFPAFPDLFLSISLCPTWTPSIHRQGNLHVVIDHKRNLILSAKHFKLLCSSRNSPASSAPFQLDKRRPALQSFQPDSPEFPSAMRGLSPRKAAYLPVCSSSAFPPFLSCSYKNGHL